MQQSFYQPAGKSHDFFINFFQQPALGRPSMLSSGENAEYSCNREKKCTAVKLKKDQNSRQGIQTGPDVCRTPISDRFFFNPGTFFNKAAE